MALTKDTVIDKVEILEDGTIQVREATRVMDSGDLIGERYHRYVLTPGQAVADQPNRIQRICTAVWTPAVVSAYQAAQAAQRVTNNG